MIPIWAHPFLETLSVLLTLLFVSSILRSKRAAGSTLAWLGAILIAPYLAVPLYLFLNGRKFPNRLYRKNKLYSSSVSKNFPQNTPTQKILSHSGGPPARANQIIELLPTGVTAYEKLIELIQGAKSSIHITTFIFGNDEVGNAVVETLTKQAARGLDVRILVDSLGATLIRHPSFKNFLRSGGKIAYFMPLLHLPFKGRTNLRNHRKLMIIDGVFGVVGGMNLANEYLGPNEDPKRWVDLGLQVRGECVEDLQEIFFQDWAFATHLKREATQEPLHAEPSHSKNSLFAQIVASGPDVPNDPIYDVLLSAIFDAKKSIKIVTPYFIPDESLTKALELAAKRGIDIQIITPLKSNHRLADLARGSFIRQLANVGVEVCFYPKMIHAKIVLIDDSLAILGSANFDMRSLLLNFELGIMIYSQSSLREIDLWIQEKKKDTYGHLPQLNFLRDIAESIGRVLGPML